GTGVSQGLARVRKAARERKREKFTALLHHLTVDLLRDSFYALQRHAAPGVDGVTWQAYETGLEERLADLDRRVPRGSSRPRAAPRRRRQRRRWRRAGVSEEGQWSETTVGVPQGAVV